MRSLRAALRGGDGCSLHFCFCFPFPLFSPVRAFCASSPRFALERVEVAHAHSYTRRAVTVGFSSHSSAVSANASPPSSSNGDKLANYVSFVADDTTGPSPTKENGAMPMRSLRSSAAAELFFFADGAKNYCRLCLEESEIAPKMHMVAPNRASHLNHVCREVVLDSLALLCMRGYPIDDIFLIWSDALYNAPVFQRIPQLVSPHWSINERTKALSHLLTLLKDLGVIDLSLAVQAPDHFDNNAQQMHHRRRVAFERLEYIGDNSWGNHLSNRMMILFPDRQWTYSQNAFSFNCFRDACEMNVTLEFMFDTLRLSDLLPVFVRDKMGTGKIKADVVEALIGELHVSVWGFEPQIYDSSCFVEVNGLGEARLSALVQHCLTEIYDLIVLSYAHELSVSAIPLAKEIAADRIWRRAYPPVRRSKDRSGAVRKSRGTTTVVGVGEVRLLPATLSLHSSFQKRPRRAPHPLRAIRNVKDVAEETLCAHARADVFAPFIESFERLGILDDCLATSTADVRPLHCAQFAALKRQLVPSLSSASLSLADAKHFDSATEKNASEADADDPQAHAMEMDNVYFRDAYFDLYPKARRFCGKENTSEDKSESESENKRESENKSESESGGGGVTARGLTRGVHLPRVSLQINALSFSAQLQMATKTIFPRICDAPKETPRGEGGKGDRICLFAISVFVPEGVKPPSAGVVTEKNLHFGEFAFVTGEEKEKEKAKSGTPVEKVTGVQSTTAAEAKNAENSADGESKQKETDNEMKEDESEFKQASVVGGGNALRHLAHAKWTVENPFFPCKPALSVLQSAS